MNRRMRTLCALGAAVALVAAALGCAHQSVPAPRSERMTLRTWASPKSAEDYPERQEEGLEYLRARPSFGIAISGGGTRSASAAWGQLRGLRDLGWIDHARYLSPVSGGAWTAAPFTFRSGSCAGESTGCDWQFLQRYVAPADLQVDHLRRFEDGSYGHALAKTQLIRLFLSRIVIRGDETYSRALGKRFLDGVGQYECGSVEECEAPPKHRYFLSGEAQLKAIQRRSADLELREEDFTFMAPQSPFLVVGASMLSKKRFADKEWDFFPLEITPLYVGIPQSMTTVKGTAVGGGYIESPGYDGRSYAVGCEGGAACDGLITVDRPAKQRVGVRHRYRYTLSDLLGATGAAPVRIVRSIGWNLIGFPEFTHTPISHPATTRAKEYAHGDGGHIDNLGLVPLLARETKKILVFVNSASAFRASKVTDTCEKKVGQLRKVFEPCWVTERDGPTSRTLPMRPLLAPEGFARINNAFVKLREHQTGPPLTYCGVFKARRNERFGIPEYDPRICWIYLDRSDGWIRQLPDEEKIFRKLRKAKAPFYAKFYRFPHYGTFLHRFWKGRVIDLGEEQVNALAHLTAWAVRESASAIAACLDLPLAGEPSELAEAVEEQSHCAG